MIKKKIKYMFVFKIFKIFNNKNYFLYLFIFVYNLNFYCYFINYKISI